MQNIRVPFESRFWFHLLTTWCQLQCLFPWLHCRDKCDSFGLFFSVAKFPTLLTQKLILSDHICLNKKGMECTMGSVRFQWGFILRFWRRWVAFYWNCRLQRWFHWFYLWLSCWLRWFSKGLDTWLNLTCQRFRDRFILVWFYLFWIRWWEWCWDRVNRGWGVWTWW